MRPNQPHSTPLHRSLLLAFGLLALLFSSTTSACSKGCLACDTAKDECLMCDPFLLYQMNTEGTCVQASMSDCEVGDPSSGDFICLQCAPGKLFDFTQKKCVDVPNNLNIKNCDYYNQAGECLFCAENHYLSNGKCDSVAIEVDGCLLFTDASFCAVCKSGQRFDADIGKCVDFTQVSNCGIHAFATCDSCLQGYYPDKSSVYGSIDTSSLDTGGMDSIISFQRNPSWVGNFRTKALSHCVRVSYNNCLTLSVTDGKVVGCATCATGRYLNAVTKNCDNYPAVVIPECDVYESDTKCYRCNSGFYTNPAQDECLAVTTIPGCALYQRNQNLCEKCDDDKFLVLPASNTCTARAVYPIPNCLVHNDNLDQCLTCNDSFLIISPDKTACLAPIVNCQSHQDQPGTPTEHLCDICNQHYFVDPNKKSCTVQNIPNCITHVTNEDNCQTCQDGYYKSGTTKIICEKKNLTNCDEYVTAEENKCLNCAMKFSKSATDTCEALTDTKCVRNTVNTTTCEACERGYFLSGGVCTASNKTYDTSCVEVTDDGKCVKCSDHDYVPFKLDSYAKDLPSGCARADRASQLCTQCAENMDGADNSGDITCTAAASTTGKCKQLAMNVKEALADNDTKCALCRTPNDHYLTGNTCTDRANYTKENCAILKPEVNECEECSTGTHSINLAQNDPLCLAPPTTYTLDAVANCRVADYFNSGKCLECNVDHNLTAGAPDTCDPSGVAAVHEYDNYYINYTNQMTITAGNQSGNRIANCKVTYYSKQDAKNYCLQCDDTFTAIVDMRDYSLKSYFLDPDNFLTSNQTNKIVECKELTDAHYMRTEAGSSVSIAAGCAAAYDVGSHLSPSAPNLNYLCVRCAEGKVGTPKLFNFDKDGGDATSWSLSGLDITDRVGYAMCTDDSTISRTMKYFSNTNLTNTYTLHFNDILYDTCSDSTMNVVQYRSRADSYTYHLGVEGPSGAERSNVGCQVIPESGRVDNCQVYYLPLKTDADRGPAIDEEFECLVCKPGHYFPADENGTKCLPIENCDLTQTNTWMGACETCDVGYSWPVTDLKDIPNFEACQANKDPTETHCMFSKGSDKECILCKPGKTLNLTTNKCEDYPAYCATPGFPRNTVYSTISSSNSIIEDAWKTILHSWFADYYKHGPGLCATCAGNRKLYMADATNDTKPVCVKNEQEQQLVDNCVKYQGNTTYKCFECAPQYVLHLITGKCLNRLSNSNLLHCKETNADTSCQICLDGYKLYNNTCHSDTNCADETNDSSNYSVCQKCNDGYKRTNLLYNCDPIEENDDPCLSFTYPSLFYGWCVKCQDCSQKPVMKLNASGFMTNFFCSNNESTVNLDDYLLMYDNNNSDNEAIFDSGSTTIPAGKYLTTTFEDSSAYPQYVCVRKGVDHNCTSWDANGYECLSCANGYYLDADSKRCKKGGISGCRAYTSVTDCGACYSAPSEESGGKAYYLHNNACHLHSSRYCNDYATNVDRCGTCDNGYHYDTNFHCQPNTKATNCQEAVTNTDECLVCSEGYFRNANLCEPHTVENCKDFSVNSDRCLSCIDGYYLSSGKCLLHTAPNCLTKSEVSNTCLTCANPAIQYPSGEKGCVDRRTLEGCQTYLAHSVDCSECVDGYYLTHGICLPDPSGIKFCTVYTSATTCTTCDSTHFFNGTACADVTSTVLECAVYSADGVCAVCNPNFFKNDTGSTCTAVNETTCATWTDIDNCATCSGNNVLKTNTDSKVQCVASGIDHCLTPVAGTPNTCTSCADGFILRAGKCDAPKVSINNCRVYDEPTENCLECYPGNLLSADKKQCLSKIAEAGEFCALGHIKSDTDPSCNMCKFGYSMNESGSCEACGGEGCFICDNSDLTKCKVCNKDYYMTSSGSCSLNNPPEPVSVAVLRAASLALLVLLFWVRQ